MPLFELVDKADPRIASEMNRLGGVYRGINGQSGIIARKKAIKFAQRKRFDLARRAQGVADSHKARVGKFDEWAADLSVQPPMEYRGRRANYRSGTAKVGKRMTGAVAGVGSPKKVQPTRVAGRRTPGAGIPVRDMSQPPIEPSRIGKADKSQMANRRTRVRRELIYDERFGINPMNDQNKEWRKHWKTNAGHLAGGFAAGAGVGAGVQHLRGRSKLMGAALGGFGGEMVGMHVGRKKVVTRMERQGKLKGPYSYAKPVEKRDRRYNPESSRQRRLGITAAATGLGGAALAVRGGRSIARETKGLRMLADREGHRVSTLTQPGAKVSMPIKYEHENVRRHSHTVSADERAAIRNMAKIPGRMVARPSRRQLAQVGGGATLVGASGTTVAYGRSRSNREWR